MKTILRPLALLCLPVLPATFSHAAFSPDLVSGDARWVVNLDLNAVRETSMGKQLLAAITAAQPGLANGTIKLDAQKVFATIGTITAYGTNLSSDPKAIDGVLVVRGTDELKKIADGLVAQTVVATPDKITEIKDLPFEAYSLSGEVIVGLPKEPVIFLSKSRASLIRAYDVFRGKAPTLAKNGAELSNILPKDPGAFLIAASTLTPDGIAGNQSPQARILQMTNAGGIAIGENNKLTYAHLQLVATNGDMADKLMKIIQGMTAMLSLAETSDKQLEEFVKSVAVERHDKTIHLSLSYSSERISEMIASAQHGRPNISAPKKPEPQLTTVEVWKADQELGSGGALGGEMLVTRTLTDVKLQTGTVVTISVQRGEGNMTPGDLGRIDYVEVVPQQPNASPLHFEAERMILNGYRVETATYASGGKLIILNNRYGSARFEFPGAEGSYTVKVRYVDDPSGVATFTLKTQAPEPVAAE